MDREGFEAASWTGGGAVGVLACSEEYEDKTKFWFWELGLKLKL